MPKKTDKPNILVIWGDDIGIANLSCYSHGLMGYQTPNIDRIAKEGMMFTDSYGEQSCTAGRSSFITGQSVYRTGLSKVGIPGAPIGMNEKIITIAAALKNQGYSTGQFGKTTSAISIRCCRPTTASTSSTTTSTTSTPKKSRKRTTIPTRRSFRTFTRRSARAGSCTPSRRTRTIQPSSPAGAGSESRRSRILALSPGSAWRPATTTSSRGPRNS